MAKYLYTMEIEVSENDITALKKRLDWSIGNLLDNVSFGTGQPEKIIESEIKEIK